jgi:hypothetical protein
MILFLADGVHHRGLTAPALSQALSLPHSFYTGTYEPFLQYESECDCLLLHLIADCKGFAHAGKDVEQALQRYVASGRPIVLLHASSAAFTRWAWWRSLVGLRWVRANDPDGVAKSRHLKRPFDVLPCSGFELEPMLALNDELYIDLHPEGPVEVLMQAEGHPQVFRAKTPQGGAILSYLPGHTPETVMRQDYQNNLVYLIKSLLHKIR